MSSIHAPVSDRLSLPSVEYAIVDHCNLKCAHCDHLSPHFAPTFVSLGDVRRDVVDFATVAIVDDFRIVGGEPLLHPDLPAILDAVRDAGIARSISLWTNGVVLHRHISAVLSKIDVLEISRYPGVRIRRLNEILEAAEAAGCQVTAKDMDRFIECYPKTRIEDRARVQAIYEGCRNAHVWHCHSVKRGRYYKCSRAPLIHEVRGMTSAEIERDSVELAGPSGCERLRAYRSKSSPLSACSWCLGTDGPEGDHEQLDRHRRAAEASALGLVF